MKPQFGRANKHLIRCSISLAKTQICVHTRAPPQSIKELQNLYLYTHEIIHILQGQLGSSTEILSRHTL